MFIYTVLLYIHTTWIKTQRAIMKSNYTKTLSIRNQGAAHTFKNPSLAVSNMYSSVFELQSTGLKKARWIANVSASSRLSSNIALVLNVKPTQSMSCFDIIERLLFAKNCDVIYTDQTLPLHQISMLKQMSLFSGTDIVFISDRREFNRRYSDDLEKA